MSPKQNIVSSSKNSTSLNLCIENDERLTSRYNCAAHSKGLEKRSYLATVVVSVTKGEVTENTLVPRNSCNDIEDKRNA